MAESIKCQNRENKDPSTQTCAKMGQKAQIKKCGKKKEFKEKQCEAKHYIVQIGQKFSKVEIEKKTNASSQNTRRIMRY